MERDAKCHATVLKTFVISLQDVLVLKTVIFHHHYNKISIYFLFKQKHKFHTYILIFLFLTNFKIIIVSEGNTPPSTFGLGSNIPNDNSTPLILKACVSENSSIITFSKVNKTMLTFIQIFGVLAAVLIGANVYVSIYNHLEIKRKTANARIYMQERIE